MPFIVVIGLLALAGRTAASPMFSGGLGIMRGDDMVEAVSAVGGSWVGDPPVKKVYTQEFGVAFPMANGFAPGVYFNRMRYVDGYATFGLFTFGASFERLFPRLGSAGIRAGIARSSGSYSFDEWVTDIEVFIRVWLGVPGLYAAVSHQFLLGVYGDVYHTNRIGVTVASPSANR